MIQVSEAAWQKLKPFMETMDSRRAALQKLLPYREQIDRAGEGTGYLPEPEVLRSLCQLASGDFIIFIDGMKPPETAPGMFPPDELRIMIYPHRDKRTWFVSDEAKEWFLKQDNTWRKYGAEEPCDCGQWKNSDEAVRAMQNSGIQRSTVSILEEPPPIRFRGERP